MIMMNHNLIPFVLIWIIFFVPSKSVSALDSATLKDVKEQLRGLNLKTTAFNKAPLMEEVKHGKTVTYKGTTMDFLELLTTYFEINLTLVRVSQSEVDRFGFKPALFNLLLNEEVDFLSYPFQRVMEYKDRVDYSFPIWIMPSTLLQAWPKEAYSRLTAPIRPYNYIVWYYFLGSSFFFVTFVAIVKYYHQRWDLKSNLPQLSLGDNISRTVVYVVTIITSQGDYIYYKARLSLRLSVGIWLLAMIVLVNAYTGTLTAFLTVPKLKPTINTFEELANSKERTLIIEPDADLAFKFMNATQGSYKVIGETLKKYPNHLLKNDSYSRIFDLIINEACIYPAAASLIEYLVASDFKLVGYCRMTPASTPLNYFNSLVMAQTKGAFYNEAFNQNFIAKILEAGLEDLWLKRYFPPFLRCHAFGFSPKRKQSIKLVDFEGVFFLLGLGLGVSFISFLLELIVFYKKSHSGAASGSSLGCNRCSCKQKRDKGTNNRVD